MKSTTIILISLIVLVATSCMHGEPPGADAWNMTSPLVSVNSSAPKHSRTKGDVKGTFCLKDADLLERKGYLDESTKNAAGINSGFSLKNASFSSNGSDCVTVIGKAVK